MVKLEEDNIILTMGKYKLSSEQFQTFVECEEWVDRNMWQLIATFTSIVTQEYLTNSEK